MPTSNRRRAARLLTCVPVGVQTPEKERIGLVRDASSTGALVFSKSKFKVDEPVNLSIRIDLEGTTTIDIKGKILRVERLTNDGFWTFKMAIVFVPERDDLEPTFKKLADRQERLFGTRTP